MIQRYRVFFVLVVLCLTGCATEQPPVEVAKPKVLPLELDDRFQIRKITQYFNEPNYSPPTTSDAVNFERLYYNYPGVSQLQFDELRGNYTTVYWRTSKMADVTVRYEYYQSLLGNSTQAMERYYPQAHGSYRSSFNVLGSNYLEFGRVAAWRVILIVNGRIVAFRQSFLWK